MKVLLERTQNDKKAAEEVLQRAMAAIKDDAAPIVAEKEKKENELIPLRQRVNKAKYVGIYLVKCRNKYVVTCQVSLVI